MADETTEITEIPVEEPEQAPETEATEAPEAETEETPEEEDVAEDEAEPEEEPEPEAEPEPEPEPKAAPEEASSVPAAKILARIFLALIIIALAVPLIALPIAPKEVTSSLDDAVELPQFTDENGNFNTAILGQLGTWFENNYPFRNELIDADAIVRTEALGISNTSQVVVGADDWIYYAGTLGDYDGSATLPERELDNIAYNLSLVQAFCEDRGAQFVLAIAPNKNTIYPEYMPYTHIGTAEPHSIELLYSYLDDYGVTYADLVGALRTSKDAGQTVYFKRDSHWNDIGALSAYYAILDEVELVHTSYAGRSFTTELHDGDIDAMLFPVVAEPEEAPVLEGGYDFTFVDTDDVTADLIETEGPGTGTLLMFRDSFGNNLIQPMAESFEHAVFTKLIPYDLGKVDEVEPDLVVIERAERHLSGLEENPPILPAPETRITSRGRFVNDSTITASRDGSYLVIEGLLDQAAIEAGTISEPSLIVVQVEDETGEVRSYIAYHTAATLEDGTRNPYGFKAFVVDDGFEGTLTVRVLGTVSGQVASLAEAQL